jgi:transcriptional regulator with XRE-family HTH domain
LRIPFGQLSRVQNKLVDTLHALQLLPPHLVKDHSRAVRAVQEALTLVGDTDDSEAIGPIDWVKFGERLLQRRTAAALTQEWLADRVGVTATTIRQLEHHNRKARRSLMLKLLAVPELNLRVSDIELSAEMSAGYRHTPTSWLGPTYDPVSMVTELAETLNGQSGQLEQTLVYIDHQSAKDWMTTCSSPEYGSEYRDSMPLATMARRIADLLGEQALTVNALGCGDGKTEALLTKHLQQAAAHAEADGAFFA